MSNRQLGPIVGATLLCNDIELVSKAYQQQLGFKLTTESVTADAQAQFWQAPRVAGARQQILQAANGDSWLRLIEDPLAKKAKPLKTHGWMSLETNVGDVDSLRKRFDNDNFKVIGEPAYLQVSDAIKAMQVIGPAGEVSYLTQVEREVPPFELPMSDAETGSLFIPVLSCKNREESVNFYQSLNAIGMTEHQNALQFETKITVLNNAWGHDIEHQYPVATLQLDDKCLFEIDQVELANPIITNKDSLPSGIAMVTVLVKNIELIAKTFNKPIYEVESNYYPGQRLLLLEGPSGELLELVEAG